MASPLLKQVAEYCWSNNFLDVFRNFFKDHAEAFVDAPPVMHGGEHNLEYYNLFQDYLVIYEKTLTAYLDTIDCPIEDFYAEVRSTKTESTDAYMQYFIDCLLASADYDSFYKVMAKQGSLLKHSRGDSKAESKDNGKAKFASSSKAEGKSSKAGDDDEDDDKGVK